MSDTARAAEVARKIEMVQVVLDGRRAARLRGIDWFAWITAGGSSAVLLAAETGIAEVVVTERGAWVLTDEIEAKRLIDEELPAGIEVKAAPWADLRARESMLDELIGNRGIVSDRPGAGEDALPEALVAAKRTLTSLEIQHYREVGRMAAEAMTEALLQAEPGWSEYQLAGAGAGALLARGLDPGLVMAAGERRMKLYRHPMPTHAPLGLVAMLVFCARGHGLYANLTRFVSFAPLSAEANEMHRQVREVEAQALALSRPGTPLEAVYREFEKGYAALGHPQAIREHHQGGTTGYLSREVVATADSVEAISANMAVAWNPSLPGAKVEDTFLVTESGLVNLTMDPSWPTAAVSGLERPLVLER